MVSTITDKGLNLQIPLLNSILVNASTTNITCVTARGEEAAMATKSVPGAIDRTSIDVKVSQSHAKQTVCNNAHRLN